MLDGRAASALTLAQVQAALRDDGSAHVAEVRRGAGEPVQLSFTVRLVSIEDP
jgi:hypothetical protein